MDQYRLRFFFHIEPFVLTISWEYHFQDSVFLIVLDFGSFGIRDWDENVSRPECFSKSKISYYILSVLLELEQGNSIPRANYPRFRWGCLNSNKYCDFKNNRQIGHRSAAWYGKISFFLLLFLKWKYKLDCNRRFHS